MTFVDDLLDKYPKPNPTLGQKLSDDISRIGGSWTFILFLLGFLTLWIAINVLGFLIWQWDPYPFVFLNLILAMISSLQAPIILMAQNRSAEHDRRKAERDYAINRKAEQEVEDIQRDLDEIKSQIREHHLWLKEQHELLQKQLRK